MTTVGVVVRRARPDDLPALGRMGALLLNAHYEFDRNRFMSPGDDPAGGYAWFLGTQLRDPDVIVLAAERGGEVVGYLYAALEPQSWKELRDAAGFIHDLVVEKPVRGQGIATALIDAALAWFKERGAPRVILGTAEQNDQAQRLFTRLGFRRTMVEMTKEL